MIVRMGTLVSELRRPPLSLRGSISAAILLTAMAVLSVTCALFMVEQRSIERRTFDEATRRLTQMVARYAGPMMIEGQATPIDRALEPLQNIPAIRAAALLDVRGHALAGFHNQARLDPAAQLIEAPITMKGEKVGEIRLWIRPPKITALLPQYLAMGGALFFTAMALALFLGRWLAARITEPVGRLTLAMEEAGKSADFSRRLNPLAGDEIGRLTESYNNLLDALAENDGRLQHTLKDLREARDAAQAASIQKSQFLANMSHEIRTPLNGVLAMAQIMARDDLTPAQQSRLDVIRQSGQALLELLNDVLDMSKIEAGKFELLNEDFDLNLVMRELRAGFSPLADKRQIAFRVELAPGAEGLRHGDAGRLRQILNNLVSNALKFTEAGQVAVRVEGMGPDGGEGVRISVADSGIGIAEDKLPLLFNKFSQVDASATRRFGGTGLGLAICREVAALMGGRIEVESRLGQGSIFTAVLPLPRRSPPAASAISEAGRDETTADAAVGPDAPLRVLAAEDNATNRLVLSTIMQIFGCDLVLVEDGAKAVEAWQADDFDLILMDIQMPVMDGMAATQAIRTAERASGRARTPIIALSANALTHQVSEYLAAGMDAHVAKPIELTKLQETLDAVVLADRTSQAA
jgi:signal transduction histidine kinase